MKIIKNKKSVEMVFETIIKFIIAIIVLILVILFFMNTSEKSQNNKTEIISKYTNYSK
jgi:hypothetical protein